MTFPMFDNGYSRKNPNFYNMLLLSLIVHFKAITIVLLAVPSLNFNVVIFYRLPYIKYLS